MLSVDETLIARQ